MAQYNATLDSMRGHVRQIKPNASPTLVTDWLNERVRSVLDMKQLWAGLIKRVVLAVPDAYATGSISLTPGSMTVTGSGTAWPVGDVVNTTVSAAVQIGEITVTPVSMAGITNDTILLVDAGGSLEVVPVLDVTARSFTAVFTKQHNAGFTITCSSLADRQLRQSITSPIFTVIAVVSPTQLTLDTPWGAPAITGASYEILKMYYTVATDIKEWMSATDPQQNCPIRFHVPLEVANRQDPTRQTGGFPTDFIDMKPNLCGNMQYELYPPQRTARQIEVVYYQQWKQMKAPGDRPPHFINPDVFSNGACAKALRTRVVTDPKIPDPYYDPAVARDYDALFAQGVALAINADNQKAQLALTFQSGLHPGGSSYWQSHDPDVEGLFNY